MKTLEQCKNEVAKKWGYVNWKHVQFDCMQLIDVYHDEAAELYASQFKQEWINVETELPFIDNAFLVCDKWGYMSVCGFSPFNNSWYPKIDGNHPNWDSTAVTYWQPLPESPIK